MQLFNSLRSFALVSLLVCGLVAVADADTILTFERSNGQGSLFSSDIATYGDRVTANNQAGLAYGGQANTPNIVADLDGGLGWPSQYGDLVNVLYPSSASGILQVKLTADPGFNVILQSFDLAGWPSTDYTINSVNVFDGNGQNLFSQSNVLVQGDTTGPRHTSFAFAPLTAAVIDIRIDSSNITAPFRAEVSGLDNLSFSQTAVPEPGAVALAILGALGIAMIWPKRPRARAAANGRSEHYVPLPNLCGVNQIRAVRRLSVAPVSSLLPLL